MALKFMSNRKPGELTTAKDIGERFGIPFDVVARVLQSLTQKGILQSEQGAYGGYQIIKDLGRVSLFDLLMAVNGDIEIAKCISDKGCELLDSCNIASPMAILNSKLNAFYSSILIRDLIGPSQGKT